LRARCVRLFANRRLRLLVARLLLLVAEARSAFAATITTTVAAVRTLATLAATVTAVATISRGSAALLELHAGRTLAAGPSWTA
jgi:hypothetical protein